MTLLMEKRCIGRALLTTGMSKQTQIRDPTKTGKTGILDHIPRTRKDAGEQRSVIITLVPGRVREHVLEAMSIHVKDQKVNGSSQHGSLEANCARPNLVSCCDKQIGFLGKEREGKAVCLDFSKAFNTVFSSTVWRGGLGNEVCLENEAQSCVY